jgi:hypothetical protein
MGARSTVRPDLEELHVYGAGSASPLLTLPAEFHWVSLTADEASTYRELRILRSDLDFAIAVLSNLVETLNAAEFATNVRDLDRDDQRARWNAALVAYARAFLGGVGERLRSEIFDVDAADLHAYFMALRNRHVAHSVSEYEEVHVMIALSGDDPTIVDGLLDAMSTEQSPGRTRAARLLELAHIAREHVQGRLEAERQRLLECARANVADLARRERLTSVPVSRYDDDVRPRRSRRR